MTMKIVHHDKNDLVLHNQSTQSNQRKNIRQITIEGDYTKYFTGVLQYCQGHPYKVSLKTVTAERSLWSMTIKCDVVSWLRSWNRKRQ